MALGWNQNQQDQQQGHRLDFLYPGRHHLGNLLSIRLNLWQVDDGARTGTAPTLKVINEIRRCGCPPVSWICAAASRSQQQQCLAAHMSLSSTLWQSAASMEVRPLERQVRRPADWPAPLLLRGPPALPGPAWTFNVRSTFAIPSPSSVCPPLSFPAPLQLEGVPARRRWDSGTGTGSLGPGDWHICKLQGQGRMRSFLWLVVFSSLTGSIFVLFLLSVSTVSFHPHAQRILLTHLLLSFPTNLLLYPTLPRQPRLGREAS